MAAEPWNADAVRDRLAFLCPGLTVEVVEETGSTNTDLMQRVREAGRDEAAASSAVVVRRSIESAAFSGSEADSPFSPMLLIAERQTAGRGRQGRPWQSAAGASLTFSLATSLGAADWSGLSLAIGVALAEALEPTPATPPKVGLKWPNDLWLGDGPARGRKLGGVLIETVPLGRQRIAVIGVGMNLRSLEADASFSSGFACVHELDAQATAADLLARLAPASIGAIATFERAGFAAFRPRFAARDLLLGHAVTTTQADALEGVAEGVTAHGSLIVSTPSGATRFVSSGEVSVRLGAAAAVIRPASS